MASLPYPSPDATPSPAETLRRAAVLMCENVARNGLNAPHTMNCGYDQIEFGVECDCRTPAVMLAVAALLEAAHSDWLRLEHSLSAASVRVMSGGTNDPDANALAVARAYLGES